jgi:hypothetical protein
VTTCGAAPPLSADMMQWAALCHPSKTQRPGLDPKYRFNLIKSWSSVLDSTTTIKTSRTLHGIKSGP